jgi:hypothetical protein
MEYQFDIKDFDADKLQSFNQIKIIESDNFSSVNRTCSEALEFSNMCAIIGDPGYGKTTALQYFTKKHERVFYITVKKSMTPKIFYSLLLEVVGFQNMHKQNNVYYIIDSIAYYLSESTEKNLIIIDEAGKLTHRELLYLHDLRDSVATNTGIVLSGPRYFEANIKEMAANGMEGLPELSRRIVNWVELYLPSSQEKRAICMEYGIIGTRLLKHLSSGSEYRTLSDIYSAIKIFGILFLRHLQDEQKRQACVKNKS